MCHVNQRNFMFIIIKIFLNQDSINLRQFKLTINKDLYGHTYSPHQGIFR